MVDILVTGSAIIAEEGIIRNGYVYIKDGIIVDYGESPVPEDYTFAGLLLGGEGRIIAPGLVGILDALAYPIRLNRPSMKERLTFYKSNAPDLLAKASLPAIYEAHMNGITTIIVEGVDPRIASILEENVGGNYYLALPSCVDEDIKSPLIKARISGSDCQGESQVVEINGWGYSGGERVLAFFSRASYSLTNIDSVYYMSRKLAAALGMTPPSINKGVNAEIAVYNTLKPPAMLLYKGSDSYIINVYSSGAKIESLIIGEDVLVDVGEHLYIVDKQFDEAKKASERLTR